MITKIDIRNIKPNFYQPESRVNTDEATAEKFGKSILEHGLLQIPVGRQRADLPTENGFSIYEMGDGWLRRAGFQWLADHGQPEFQEMPVDVRELTDRQMADMVMEANTIRKDLNPIELAKLYKRYLEDFKIPQIELAKRHNCSQGEIANTIRLLELPEDIQAKVISQEISETHGRQLLRLNYNTELQQKVLDQAVKQSYTINELDQAITRTLWDSTRSLKPNNYGFDVSTCDDCPKRVMAADPWGDSKKQYRCPDTECWDKKQNEAEAARAAKIQGKTEESTGVKKILTGNDLRYGQYETLSNEAKKLLDKPEECNTCDKTALYRYRADDTYNPQKVCLNPNCFRQKKSRKTREDNKIKKQQDQELTVKLGETFRSLADHKAIAVVIARGLLRYPKLNIDGEADMLAYFPDLPADKKHRLDDAAVKKWLSDRPLDELLRICAAAVITHSRRQSAGFYSTKLDGNAKENFAILTKPSAPDEPAVKSDPGSKAIPNKSTPKPGSISLRVPSGIPFEQLIQVGSLVKTNYNTGPYQVEKIIPEDKPGYYSLACSDPKAKRNKDDSLPKGYEFYWLNDLVAVDGRILKRLESSKDEVFLVDTEGKVTNVTRQDRYAVPQGLIPEGVRLCEDVPQAECNDCNLATEDHTIGFKFTVGHVSHKVCIKDYRAWEKKSGGISTEKPSLEMTETEFAAKASAQDPLATLKIHTPPGDGGSYCLELSDAKGSHQFYDTTLKGCIHRLAAYSHWGKEDDTILGEVRSLPQSSNRDLLISILEGGKPAERAVK